MKNFEVGKTYYARSICDHDQISFFTVSRRTEKSVWNANGKRFKIHLDYNGNESVSRGSYSMAGTFSAERVATAAMMGEPTEDLSDLFEQEENAKNAAADREDAEMRKLAEALGEWITDNGYETTEQRAQRRRATFRVV